MATQRQIAQALRCVLLAAAVLLPVACRIVPPDPATTILVDRPEVFTKERLLQRRFEEKERLETLLKDSPSLPSTLQGYQDVRAFEGIVNRLDLTAEPLAVELDVAQRALQLDSLEAQREAASLRNQMAIIRLQNELGDLRKQHGNAAANTGASGGGTTPATTPGTDTDTVTQEELDDQLETLRTELQASIDAETETLRKADEMLKTERAYAAVPSDGPGRTQAELSPINRVRDEFAYRNTIQALLREQELDDVHDQFGGTIYTLKFDVTLVPVWRTSRLARVDVELVPPSPDDRDYEILYTKWRVELERQLQREATSLQRAVSSGRLSDADWERLYAGLSQAQERITGRLRERLRAAHVQLEQYERRTMAMMEVPPDARRTRAEDSSFDAALAAAKEVRSSLEDLVASDRSGSAAQRYQVVLEEARGARVARAEFDRAFARIAPADHDRARLADEEVDRVLRSQPATGYRDGAGGISDESLAPAGLYAQDLALARLRKVAAEYSLTAAQMETWKTLCAYMDCTRDALWPGALATLDEKAQKAAHYGLAAYVCSRYVDLFDVVMFAEPIDVAKGEHVVGYLPNVAEGPVTMEPDRTLLTNFVRSIKALSEQECGAAYVYSVDPKEEAQNISDVAATERLRNLVLSLDASLPNAGISGKSYNEYVNRSQTLLHAISRKPLVVGFAFAGPHSPAKKSQESPAGAESRQKGVPGSQVQRESQSSRVPQTDTPAADPESRDVFGWVFGPRFSIEDGKAVFRHTSQPYQVQASVVLPAWWESVSLRVSRAWVGKVLTRPTTSDEELEELKVPLTVDYSALTLALLRLRGAGDDEPYLETPEEPYALRVGRQKQTLLLRGHDLWRDPKVFLGSQQADDIDILPDMRGLLVQFDEVREPLAAEDGLADLTVITPRGDCTARNAVRLLAKPAGTDEPARFASLISSEMVGTAPGYLRFSVKGAVPDGFCELVMRLWPQDAPLDKKYETKAKLNGDVVYAEPTKPTPPAGGWWPEQPGNLNVDLLMRRKPDDPDDKMQSVLDGAPRLLPYFTSEAETKLTISPDVITLGSDGSTRQEIRLTIHDSVPEDVFFAAYPGLSQALGNAARLALTSETFGPDVPLIVSEYRAKDKCLIVTAAELTRKADELVLNTADLSTKYSKACGLYDGRKIPVIMEKGLTITRSAPK